MGFKFQILVAQQSRGNLFHMKTHIYFTALQLFVSEAQNAMTAVNSEHDGRKAKEEIFMTAKLEFLQHCDHAAKIVILRRTSRLR